MQLKGTTAFLGDWLGEFIFHSNDELAKDFKLNANLLTMPIGILWGDLDTVTPISDAYRIQTYLKNSQLHLISGVGHIPQLESPNEFHKVLINNLKSVDGNR